MSIADQITRLNNAKASIKESIKNKGVDVSDDALLDEYPALIDSIEVGGEGGDPYYENFYNLRTNNGTNMDTLFARTTGELDLRQLDTSKVTSMYYMFDSSSANVNIDGWDTSNVTDMSYMFYYFSGSIDISKLDTSSLTNVEYMFYYANTDKIILTGLSFPSTTALYNMFSNAKGTTLDLSSWDISNIKNMYYMFHSAAYKRIDLTGWKTTNVTNMNSMFYNYSNPLEELIIPDWDMTNTTSYNNFYYVGNSDYKNKLKLVDLSRSNDVTITKIASCLPTRTTTTYGTVMVPSNTSQEALDALVAKYWRPVGADLSPTPTSVEIVSELDELKCGKPRTTRVAIGACEPWYGDPSKVEIVNASEHDVATLEGDIITTIQGASGDIELEARIIDTQEVIGRKIITIWNGDSYPNVVKWRTSETMSTASYNTVLTVNGTSIKGNDTSITHDKTFDMYTYVSSDPIGSIEFSPNYCKIKELIKINTSNMYSLEEMFYKQTSLVSLDASDWDTSKITNMNYMFYDCYALTELDLSNFDMTNVTNANEMFKNCNKLHIIRLDNCSNTTINKIIKSSYFPTNTIDGVIRTIYCKESEAAGLTPPTNWVFSFVEEEEPTVNPNEIIFKARGNKYLLVNHSEVTDQVEELSTDDNGIITCRYISPDTITHFGFSHGMGGNWDVTELVQLDTSNITDMSNMFLNCGLLTSLDLSSFDTSKVTNMSSMFYYCSSLETLDLSSFDTANVTDMGWMFEGCGYLTTLDLSNFDMTNVTNMRDMLRGCHMLYELRLDNCSNDTISKIITSSSLPTDDIGSKTIYCKESNAAGLTPPTNWKFSYIEE